MLLLGRGKMTTCAIISLTLPIKSHSIFIDVVDAERVLLYHYWKDSTMS